MQEQKFVTAEPNGIVISNLEGPPIVLPRASAEVVCEQLKRALKKFDMCDYRNREVRFYIKCRGDEVHMDAVIKGVHDDEIVIFYTEDEEVIIGLDDIISYSTPINDWRC